MQRNAMYAWHTGGGCGAGLSSAAARILSRSIRTVVMSDVYPLPVYPCYADVIADWTAV